jgi:hypothetical protein
MESGPGKCTQPYGTPLFKPFRRHFRGSDYFFFSPENSDPGISFSRHKKTAMHVCAQRRIVL